MATEDRKVRFEHAQLLLERLNTVIKIAGIWPINRTIWDTVKFTMLWLMFITLISSGVVQCLTQIRYFEKVVRALPLTITCIIMLAQMSTVRFNKKLYTFMIQLGEENRLENFNDDDEIGIFIEYTESFEKPYKIIIWALWINIASFYFLPIIRFSVDLLRNQTTVLVIPHPVPEFIDTSTTQRAVLVYFCVVPIGLLGTNYYATCGVLAGAITHICVHLAVLSHRARNFTKIVFNQVEVQKFVQKHIRIIRLVKMFNDAQQLVFLIQLFSAMFVLALLLYDIITHVGEAGRTADSVSYIFNMLLTIYWNFALCNALTTESEKLFEACYGSDWYNTPHYKQRILLMCMFQAKNILALTAGKFYQFSHENFVNILKSIMAYASILRTLTNK